MTTSRLPYADADTTATMAGDCAAAAATMHLPLRPLLAGPAPSLRFEDYPREVRKRDITIDAATAHLAGALELHLD